MGKPAGRLGDMGSNHGAWHPSPLIAGSGNVFTNGKPAARQGDALAPHKKPKKPPHGRSMSSGSSTVFINGKPAVRVGDSISCGGNLSVGSSNVFIGDSPQLSKPSEASLPDIAFPNQRGQMPQPNTASEHKETIPAPAQLSEQQRHAQCNIESAQSGAPFVQGI